MDAASTGSLAGLSAQGFNLSALSKLGPPFALNAQGKFFSILAAFVVSVIACWILQNQL
jgi:hypothetical protein